VFAPHRGHPDGQARRVEALIYFTLVKIVFDAERCTGHGRCYSLAPELFGSDEEGHSVVLAPDVPPGLESKARLAVENCPESCLSLDTSS
jgi:ferredoxin